MENGYKLVLHLTNCTSCSELNADRGADDSDRVFGVSATSTVYSKGLMFLERTYSTITPPLLLEEIAANNDTVPRVAKIRNAQFAVFPFT